LAEIDATLVPLQEALKESQDYMNGSDQERVATDKAYVAQVKLAKLLTQLEEQMVPANYATPVPEEYSDLPQLKKRATVEMVVKKGEDGATFERNGVNIPQAKMVMIIDGYAGA
jgi:peptidylprolyl isomerase